MTIAAIFLAVALATGPLPDHALLDYAGMVGDATVRMNLWREGPRAEGYYLYESRYVPIDVGGTIQADGGILLVEKRSNGTGGEKFSGRVDGDRLEGVWTSRDGKHKEAFHLIRQREPWLPPSSWRRFERTGCPVTFLLPPRWIPRQDQGWTTLDTTSDVYNDALSVSWGSGTTAGPYESRPDGWYVINLDVLVPAHDTLTVSGLRVARDDLPCQVESSRGYEGMGDCASALAHGSDFWVVFQSSGPRYAPALDLILTTLQPAAKERGHDKAK